MLTVLLLGLCALGAGKEVRLGHMDSSWTVRRYDWVIDWAIKVAQDQGVLSDPNIT